MAGPTTETGGQRMYFTGTNADFIGRITLSGVQTNAYALFLGGDNPHKIVAGPDDLSLWWSETASNSIGKMTFPGHGVSAAATGLTGGPEGITVAASHLWFVERQANKVTDLDPSNGSTEYTTLLGAHGPVDVAWSETAFGGDGYVWYTANADGAVAAINPNPPNQQKGPLRGADGAEGHHRGAQRLGLLRGVLRQQDQPGRSSDGRHQGGQEHHER